MEMPSILLMTTPSGASGMQILATSGKTRKGGGQHICLKCCWDAKVKPKGVPSGAESTPTTKLAPSTGPAHTHAPRCLLCNSIMGVSRSYHLSQAGLGGLLGANAPAFGTTLALQQEHTSKP